MVYKSVFNVYFSVRTGFTIALQELYYTIPTLWDKTVEYTKLYPQYIYDKTQPDSLFGMVTNDNGWTYNLCHFWSNFEVGYRQVSRQICTCIC